MRQNNISKPQLMTALGMMSRVRHGLVTSLVLTALVIILKQPLPGSAADPQGETYVPPSPTPLQVTPPPRGTVITPSAPDLSEGQRESSLVDGIPAWTAAGLVVLLILAISLFLYVRRRRSLYPGPLPARAVPFLKSADGNLYFRLDKLDENGLIIGRGSQGVDIQIDETTRFVDTVSKRHARIYYHATYGHVIIEDLGSLNGIFINGRQAPRKNILKDGWTLGLGSVTLTYHDGESDTGPLDS